MNLSVDDKVLNLEFSSNNLKSYQLLETSRKVNIFATVSIALIGFLGHSLIIFVFGQKRFRTNSSNVLLLCLAINDSFFLLVHLFEDTLRTYQDIYIHENNSNTTLNSILISLNITDKLDLVCRLVNYFRHCLRFMSSYILVVFSLQRLSVIYNPLTSIFKHNKSAWITITITLMTSFISNIWTLFLFELQPEDKKFYCDIKKAWATEYILITAFYIGITLLIPIILILGCNFLIILALHKSETKRKEYNSTTCVGNRPTPSRKSAASSKQKIKRFDSVRVNKKLLHKFQIEMKPRHSLAFRIKPFYSSINRIANRATSTHSSTKILLTISSVFVLLNLPYLITWILFYYNMAFREIDLVAKDHLFAILQISEIFYVSNYSVLFYLYCISGSKFRNQLKYSVRSNRAYNAQVEFYIEDVQSSGFQL